MCTKIRRPVAVALLLYFVWGLKATEFVGFYKIFNYLISFAILPTLTFM
jgi:hypothetical protein